MDNFQEIEKLIKNDIYDKIYKNLPIPDLNAIANSPEVNRLVILLKTLKVPDGSYYTYYSNLHNLSLNPNPNLSIIQHIAQNFGQTGEDGRSIAWDYLHYHFGKSKRSAKNSFKIKSINIEIKYLKNTKFSKKKI